VPNGALALLIIPWNLQMPAPLRSPNPQASLNTLREVLAYNIRAFRVERNLSQAQLGHLAQLDRTFVSQVERARVNISLDNIEKLAKALELPADQLLKRPWLELAFGTKPQPPLNP